jgi:DNA-binding response OmpR family regulator
MRVLVVEDEASLADYLAAGLRGLAMAVDVAYDGKSALERLTVNAYDIVLLDRDLPDIHGDDLCRDIIEGAAPPRVLMLTAAASVRDKVEGLGLGADDYLTKPFDYQELVARVQALARRPGRALPVLLRSGELVVDTARREAFRGDRRVILTPKEFAVLEALLGARGAVVSAEELLERVWDENVDPLTSAVRVTMSKLRAKLGKPDVIITVPGIGYRA